MKKEIYICIVFLLFSCNKKNSESKSVELEIINKEIISNNKSLVTKGEPFKNLITYRLTNKSDEKLFFILDEDILESGIQFTDKEMSEPNFFGKKGKLLYNIFTDKNVKPINAIINSDNFENGNIDCLYDIQKIKQIRTKITELDIKVFEGDFNFSNSIRNNSFVLYPKQSKYFKTVLYLPKQIDLTSNVSSEIKFNYNEKYNFNLIYTFDGELIKKGLPNYKLKELKENNIKIFNGKILSNKIPVKFVK